MYLIIKQLYYLFNLYNNKNYIKIKCFYRIMPPIPNIILGV